MIPDEAAGADEDAYRDSARRYAPSLKVDLNSHIATFRRRQAVIDGGGFCCTPDSGDCCGPGGWCCARAGKHNHEDES